MSREVIYSGPAKITVASQSFDVRAELLVEMIDGEGVTCALVEAPQVTLGHLSANNHQTASLVISGGRKYALASGSLSGGSGDMVYLDVSPAPD